MVAEEIFQRPERRPADDQRGRVGRTRLPQEGGGVRVKWYVLKWMLEARMAIHDQANAVEKVLVLRGECDPSLPRGIGDPLTLIPAGLDVILDRHGPPRRQPVDIVCSILLGPDLTMLNGPSCHRVACREGPGTHELARFDELRHRERKPSGRAWIQDCGEAVRQVLR